METTGADETENKYEPNQDVEQEYKLIERAYEEFNCGNYDRCLETLDELEKCNCTNTQLSHNRAVTKFYQSECKDHASLLKALGENANEGGLLARSSPTSSTSPNIHVSPIARYNIAVIYYHRHMYKTAIEILMPLVNQLDDLEEQIAGIVSTFLLRLLLVTNQLRKAAAFLEMLQSPERKAALNLSRDALLSEETSTSRELSATANHENFQQAYKFLALQTCVLNRKPIVVAEDGSAEYSALKAHQYYIMKDFQMAAKQLKKVNEIGSSNRTDMLNTCIANNMGVIHLRVRHYAIAAKFFQDAISFDKHIAVNMRNVSLYQMGTVRTCEILYNLGIAMLHLRRPKEAFKCFFVPLKSYHCNPRLWFRISEACIMDHEMKMLDEDQKPIVTSVVNSGDCKMYLLKPTASITYTPEQNTEPGPTINFAAVALRNALTLTKYYKSVFETTREDEPSAESEYKSWLDVKDNNFCNPSRPISKNSLDNMLCAIHAAYSYVSLRIGDYVCALEMAQELLRAEKLSDAHRLLGHMYAGEALIMLDKLGDARPHFEPTFVSSLNEFDFETKDWRVKSLDAAQNVVRYNLAVVMALQGDFDLSRSVLNSCTHPIVAAKVLSLKTYLDIKMGKVV